MLENAKGMKDVFPEDKIIKDKIISRIKDVFELYGYSPLETPTVERFDILTSKYAGGIEIVKEIFKVTDQANRELGLRYDLTVPFARFIGMNPNLKMPFKRYQIEKVWRDGPMGSSRYREFWQCDIDIVGNKQLTADAEMIMIADDVFSEMNLKSTIKINNRKLLNGIMMQAGIPEDRIASTILSIDKIEKIGIEEVRKEIREKGVGEDKLRKLLEILTLGEVDEALLGRLDGMITNAEGKEGIKELRELFGYLSDMNLKNELIIDVALARGLAYYTGSIYEIVLKDSKVKSSVAGGGRYDKMIGQFLKTGAEYPAVGISFGLDRIYDALEKEKKRKSVAKVFIIPIKTLKQSLLLASALRKNGIKTDIDLQGRGPSKNLEYAGSLGIPFAIFVGQEELEKEKYKVRNMETGEEKFLDEKELAGFLSKFQ
ncbi:MAG TPA: histidine--tRNA ligase [Candidatus Nanoarchaeia archaeon]|nr:histidine--tRNA ligase [Candidatus Nanoarchaeia archaeon]